MQHHTYTCHGTCSTSIAFDLTDEDTVTNVQFTRGCNGNLQGIAKLVEGLPRTEVIRKLQGISCAGRPTSCPDQLAKALKTFSDPS